MNAHDKGNLLAACFAGRRPASLTFEMGIQQRYFIADTDREGDHGVLFFETTGGGKEIFKQLF